jgi:catechol 2,3-dioxygenase-like lactoylglutathione lyase family enzyme
VSGPGVCDAQPSHYPATDESLRTSILRSGLPCLVVQGAAKALDFYAEVFGATERMRFSGPDGTIAHAEVQIGDAVGIVEQGAGGRRTRPHPDRQPSRTIVASAASGLGVTTSAGPPLSWTRSLELPQSIVDQRHGSASASPLTTLGRVLAGIAAFEVGNVAATLLSHRCPPATCPTGSVAAAHCW